MTGLEVSARLAEVSAPLGPAESLFKESYYQLMKTALKEDGILCCQGEHGHSGMHDWAICSLCGKADPQLPHRRVPVAAPGPHQGDEAFLQISLPCGGLCLLHHPHLPKRPDWFHAM